jgi:hypothetical protein
MSDLLKKGLSSQEKITQKKPGKHDEKTQRPQAQNEKAPSYGKPGSFKFKS